MVCVIQLEYRFVLICGICGFNYFIRHHKKPYSKSQKALILRASCFKFKVLRQSTQRMFDLRQA